MTEEEALLGWDYDNDPVCATLGISGGFRQPSKFCLCHECGGFWWLTGSGYEYSRWTEEKKVLGRHQTFVCKGCEGTWVLDKSLHFSGTWVNPKDHSMWTFLGADLDFSVNPGMVSRHIALRGDESRRLEEEFLLTRNDELAEFLQTKREFSTDFADFDSDADSSGSEDMLWVQRVSRESTPALDRLIAPWEEPLVPEEPINLGNVDTQIPLENLEDVDSEDEFDFEDYPGLEIPEVDMVTAEESGEDTPLSWEEDEGRNVAHEPRLLQWVDPEGRVTTTEGVPRSHHQPTLRMG